MYGRLAKEEIAGDILIKFIDEFIRIQENPEQEESAREEPVKEVA